VFPTLTNHTAIYFVTSLWCQRWAAEYWASLGAPRSKLIIGMATYGRSFTLSNPSTSSGIGAPASGPGVAGAYTGEAGMLAYYEVGQVQWPQSRGP
jgi:GH18 family chitinase